MPTGAGPVFCPDCGAKNKAGWEFCARCGSTLQDASNAKPGAELAPRPEPSGPTIRSLLGGMAAVAFAVAGFVFFKGQAGEPPPSTAAFAFPTPPPRPPAPVATPHESGRAYREGRSRLNRGDVAGALAGLAEAVGLDPQDAALRALYGEALWQADQRERALDEFRAAAQADTEFASRYADALMASHRPGEAAEQYRIALENQPADQRTLRSFGQALLQAKRPGEAVEPLRRAVAEDPDILTSEQLGSALEESGDQQGAEEVYRDVLARMPGATVSRARLAELLQRQGQVDEAVSLLREGLRAGADSPALQRSLGSVLDRAGRRDEAVRAFQEFLKLAPNDPVAPLVEKRLAELQQGRAGVS